VQGQGKKRKGEKLKGRRKSEGFRTDGNEKKGSTEVKPAEDK